MKVGRATGIPRGLRHQPHACTGNVPMLPFSSGGSGERGIPGLGAKLTPDHTLYPQIYYTLYHQITHCTPRSHTVPPDHTLYPQITQCTPDYTLYPQITNCTPNLHIVPPTYTLYPQITHCTPKLHIVPPNYTLYPQTTHCTPKSHIVEIYQLF